LVQHEIFICHKTWNIFDNPCSVLESSPLLKGADSRKVFCSASDSESDNSITNSVLPRQYLVPELSLMGFNIATELRYEVLLRKHRKWQLCSLSRDWPISHKSSRSMTGWPTAPLADILWSIFQIIILYDVDKTKYVVVNNLNK
jgi:hypothetical protein